MEDGGRGGGGEVEGWEEGETKSPRQQAVCPDGFLIDLQASPESQLVATRAQTSPLPEQVARRRFFFFFGFSCLLGMRRSRIRFLASTYGCCLHGGESVVGMMYCVIMRWEACRLHADVRREADCGHCAVITDAT